MSRSRGLYEVLITEAIEIDLRALDDRLKAHTTPLRAAEAADRIALHVGRIVQRAVAALGDEQRVALGIALARTIIGEIDRAIEKVDAIPDSPIEPGSVLRAVLARLPDGQPESIDEPLIPLLDTALLTNAPGEPRVGSQLLTEIHSADRIDVVMAFIRRSGIAPLRDALRRSGHSKSCRKPGAKFASRTTRAPRVSTPRPGCSIAGRISPRPTLDRRT